MPLREWFCTLAADPLLDDIQPFNFPNFLRNPAELRDAGDLPLARQSEGRRDTEFDVPLCPRQRESEHRGTSALGH